MRLITNHPAPISLAHRANQIYIAKTWHGLIWQKYTGKYYSVKEIPFEV